MWADFIQSAVSVTTDFFVFDTKLPEMTMLASKEFTATNKSYSCTSSGA